MNLCWEHHLNCEMSRQCPRHPTQHGPPTTSGKGYRTGNGPIVSTNLQVTPCSEDFTCVHSALPGPQTNLWPLMSSIAARLPPCAPITQAWAPGCHPPVTCVCTGPGLGAKHCAGHSGTSQGSATMAHGHGSIGLQEHSTCTMVFAALGSRGGPSFRRGGL